MGTDNLHLITSAFVAVLNRFRLDEYVLGSDWQEFNSFALICQTIHTYFSGSRITKPDIQN
jgi:hypothetical protein